MLAILSILVALTVLAASSMPAARAAGSVLLGLNPINYVDGPTAKDLQQEQRMGAAAVRIWANWRKIEARRGRYDWKQLDDAVAGTTNLGMTPLLLVTGSPQWACAVPLRSEPDSLCPPRDVGAWTAFLTRLVSRYQGKTRFYQVWNEPNQDFYWVPKPNADSYARLLLASYQAIKGAQPSAVVISGGLAGTDLDFMGPVLKGLRGRKAFDATALHHYRHHFREWSDVTTPVGPQDRFHWTLPNGQDAQLNLKEEWLLYQRLAQEHGYGWPDLWITEFGWGAYDNRPRPGLVTLAQQAEYLRQTYTLVRDDPEMRFVKALFWFCDQDWSENPNDKVALEDFGFFGLARMNGQWKPAARTFRELAK